MKKTVLIPAITLVMVGSSLVAVVPANAFGPGGNTKPLIQRLSQRFGLKESDVQQVFVEHHVERQQQMLDQLQQRLDQAVTDGKISSAQREALLSKFKEIREQHQANWEQYQNMTGQERRDARAKAKNELEAWAKDQGIDLQLLFSGNMRRRMF